MDDRDPTTPFIAALLARRDQQAAEADLPPRPPHPAAHDLPARDLP